MCFLFEITHFRLNVNHVEKLYVFIGVFFPFIKKRIHKKRFSKTNVQWSKVMFLQNKYFNREERFSYKKNGHREEKLTFSSWKRIDLVRTTVYTFTKIKFFPKVLLLCTIEKFCTKINFCRKFWFRKILIQKKKKKKNANILIHFE